MKYTLSKLKLTFQELFMALFPSILFILLYLLRLSRVCFTNICIKQSSRGKNSRKTRLKINDSSSLHFSNQKLSTAWFNLTCYHPPGNSQDKSSLLGQRLKNCLIYSCPRGGRRGISNYVHTVSVHQYGVSIQSSTKVREMFRLITQKL